MGVANGGGRADSFSANELPLCWKPSLLSSLGPLKYRLGTSFRLRHLVLCFNLQLTGVCTCFKVGVCPQIFLHTTRALFISPPSFKTKYKANIISSLKHLSRQGNTQDVDISTNKRCTNFLYLCMWQWPTSRVTVNTKNSTYVQNITHNTEKNKHVLVLVEQWKAGRGEWRVTNL